MTSENNEQNNPPFHLRRRITSNSTFNSERAQHVNNNLHYTRTTLSVLDEDDVHQRRSRLYPGQSRQSHITPARMEEKLSPADLDYSFTNGAKLIASVWFMMICILIFVVVVLMAKSNLPKGPESNPICTNDGCRLIDNMITMLDYAASVRLEDFSDQITLRGYRKQLELFISPPEFQSIVSEG
ncbi:uncharacterized protein LOC142344355 [Convolutriloba macropyga]|uniref:uncharacterized protein LOC142344355 n=1 Tax=Convolutriloba macropyga TaxID=536237 RepID=UPI003F5267F5